MVEKEKTETHMFYNTSKRATNTFNGKCVSLSCSRKTKHWPLWIFFTLLNIYFCICYLNYGCFLTFVDLTPPYMFSFFSSRSKVEFNWFWSQEHLLPASILRHWQWTALVHQCLWGAWCESQIWRRKNSFQLCQTKYLLLTNTCWWASSQWKVKTFL